MLDFGCSKQTVDRTNTQVGTPWYTAPEIIHSESKGYSFAVDIWSTGIVMFEILTGFLPFGGDLMDPYEIYKEILDYDGEIDDIEEIEDETAVDLIQKLLTKEPGVRFNGSHAKI